MSSSRYTDDKKAEIAHYSFEHGFNKAIAKYKCSNGSLARWRNTYGEGLQNKVDVFVAKHAILPEESLRQKIVKARDEAKAEVAAYERILARL